MLAPVLVLLASFALPVQAQPAAAAVAAGSPGPYDLTTDSLPAPLGLDDATPHFGWKLRDAASGAAQSSYRIVVAATPEALARKPLWDSGVVASSASVAVPYAGPTLKPSTRYYWRVMLADAQHHAYPASPITTFETGLLDPDNWHHSNWIGYEDPEHTALRSAHAAWVTNSASMGPAPANYHNLLRLHFTLSEPIASATLYATAQDTLTASVNGRELLSPQTQPGWGRLPWRTYRSSAIPLPLLHQGVNLLALDALRFEKTSSGQTPISAILFVQYSNGTHTTLTLATGDTPSKSLGTATPPAGWAEPGFDDSAWVAPVPFPAPRDAFGGADSLGLPLQTPPVAALRHNFTPAGGSPVRSARLYITALGAYQASVNGQRVGDQVLAPGWTDFRARVTYQTYDVTQMLHPGANTLGALLAPGWYATPLEWVGQGNNYGPTPPALRAQLRIEHADGSLEWIGSDPATWEADDSPITSAEIYNGEHYDGRLAQPGWDTAGFRPAHPWAQAIAVTPQFQPALVAQSFQPIRVKQTLVPRALTRPAPGTSVYDFGQEFAGVVRVSLPRAKPGTTVRLRFGEELNPDGTLFTANLRNAQATDVYTYGPAPRRRGRNGETYQPTFTFHGFRYFELSGVPDAPPLAAVQGLVFYTDAPEATQLTTGSPMINKLYSNILWGQRSNFVGTPTDCPQRDERLGWSADAQVFWRTAAYNMDLAAFSRKYAADLRYTQVGPAPSDTMFGIYAPGTAKPNPGYGPGWSDAGVIIPYTSWLQTGDATVVRENWEAMTRYVDGITAANPDHLWVKQGGIGFGDWLSPEGVSSQALIATAFYAYDAELLARMAHALHQPRDEQKYRSLFETVRAAFQEAYVHPGAVISGPDPEHPEKQIESQTSYVLALHFDLLAAGDRAPAAEHLVDRIHAYGDRLGTGFLGTPYLLETLTTAGHADLAYHLLLNTQYPSWGYMVTHGATTMWERWNGDKMRGDPGMNSYNHYAYGAVAEWIYRYAAGIDADVDAPGFQVIDLHPAFDARLGSLDLTYQSPRGTIRSAWHYATAADTNGGGNVTWTVTIPPNTTGHLRLSSAEASHYTLDNQPLPQPVHVEPTGTDAIVLRAGTYTFHVAP